METWLEYATQGGQEVLRCYCSFTGIAVSINFIGLNSMRFLVFSGIVQGFSTPPLMLLIMLMTNKRAIMGEQVNSASMNVLGWITTGFIFAATIGLIITWFT